MGPDQNLNLILPVPWLGSGWSQRFVTVVAAVAGAVAAEVAEVAEVAAQGNQKDKGKY